MRPIRIWAPLAATTVLLAACSGGGGTPEPDAAIPLDCREKNECEVAGPLDRTISTSIVESTRYLLEGDKPLQKDVKEGALDPERMAIVHGRVLDENGEALIGVKVSAVGHADWGWVYSRKDGSYELAVNGGGAVSVSLKKNGYISLQRSAFVAWQEHGYLGNAAMTPKSETTARLASGAGPQTFRGDAMPDDLGTHEPLLIFSGDTKATAVLPDGSKKELGEFDLRVTETPLEDASDETNPTRVGSMNTSGLTFGFDFEVAEAEELGATHVQFSKPVRLVTENFLELETGEKFPFSYYNEETSSWEEEAHFTTIEVLDEDGGEAKIDADGDGSADTDSELEELGLDENARQRIAENYKPGDSLFWTTLEHFSKDQATVPAKTVVTNEAPVIIAPRIRPVDRQSLRGRVRVENQAVSEPHPIIGTPVSMIYQSDRTGAYAPGFALEVPLVGATVPANLKSVTVQVKIAGQELNKTLKPAKNLTHTFQWDGRDHLQRLVQGQQLAKISITYEYPGELDAKTKKAGPSVKLSASSSVPIGVWDATGYGLGGVSLDVLHAFDPVHKSLHYGYGEDRRAENIALVVKNLANSDDLGIPDSIVATPDGNVLMTDDGGDRILRVSPGGDIKILAQAGDKAVGDASGISNPQGIAVAKDGSVWFVDITTDSIGRITPAGKYECIIGEKSLKPKVVGSFSNMENLTFGPNGELYFNDDDIVYRYSGKTIAVYAGGGEDSKGEGIKATDKNFKTLGGLVAGPDGSLYIAERNGHRVHKVTPDGLIKTIIGTGTADFGGDGAPGTLAAISEPRGLALGKDGTLYISDMGNHRVRMLTTDGIIDTAIGGGDSTTPEGMLATSAKLDTPDGLTIDSAGALTVATKTGVLRVVPGAPKLKTTDTLVPSADGLTLFKFDPRGKHLATIDRLTGATLFKFAYNAAGQLTALADQNGNKTVFTRDDKGTLNEIVGPFGSKTKVSLTDDGVLSTLTDPLGRETTFEYDMASGLLSSSRDVDGSIYSYSYDPTNRLASVTDPTGRKDTYSREVITGGSKVTVTGPGGAVRKYTTQVGAGGSLTQGIAAPDGSSKSTVDKITTASVTLGDGSKLSIKRTPDAYFGPQVSHESYELTTPSGLKKKVAEETSLKGVTDGDALVFNEWQQTVTVNDKKNTTKYVSKDRKLTNTSPGGLSESTVFDKAGRVSSSSVSGLGSAVWTYDEKGRPTLVTVSAGEIERKTGYGYDKFGFLSKLTDPLSRDTLFENDAAGRTKTLTRTDKKFIGFVYDERDNVTSLTPPGRSAHSFDYENFVQLKSSNAPSLSERPKAGITNYTYGTNHELSKITFGDDRSLSFKYDWSERLKSTTFGATTVSYEYMTGQRIASISRTGAPKVKFGYDGPLITSVEYSGVLTGKLSSTYTPDHQLKSLTVNTDSTATYQYDLDGRTSSVAVGAKDQFLLTLTRSKTHGFVTASTFGAVASSNDYNGLGELTSTSGASALGNLSQTLTRDSLGRVTHITEVSGAKTTNIDYEYDSANRLKKETRDGVATTYGYDANGNRTSITVGATTTKATFDAQDRILTQGTATYTFTDAGHLLSKTDAGTTGTLTHDEFGNLLKVEKTNGVTTTTTEYVVDGLGRRVARRVNGTFDRYWLYQNRLRPAAEVDSKGIFTHYVYAEGGEGGAPDFMVRQSVGYRFVKDHLGSVRRVINATTGAVAQELDYDAFGKVLNDSNPGFQPFGFAGGIYDTDTGLVHFGAREYSASTGRWTNVDPIGFAGGQTNLYAYVDSDPVNRVDPSGTKGVALGLGFGAGLSYLGGGVDVALGLYVGTDGFGLFGGGTYTAGGGVYLGAGITGTYYSQLAAFRGTSYGAKVEAPFVDANPWVNDSGYGYTGSLGPQLGAWLGLALSHTFVADVPEMCSYVTNAIESSAYDLRRKIGLP